MVNSVAIGQITSPSNPKVKALRGLERKKMRVETGLFLAEGPRLVRRGIEQGWRLDTLAVAEASLGRADIAGLAADAADLGASVFSAPGRIMEKLARKDNPNAVVAAFAQRMADLPALDPGGEGRIVALYEVRDPGNLGTVLRSADCAGVGGVVLVGQCCDAFSLEAVRASMGSIFDVPLAAASLEAFAAWGAGAQRRLVGASMNGQSAPEATDLSGPVTLLMGNEQAGLPTQVEAACEVLVRIPMRGGADSLNLAQAATLITYEAWRQAGYPGARP
ncbi:MAG: RNA methyltransferase [Pseudomonadota bacterium]